ncbi:Cuticle Protein CPR RR-2 16 [Frankliniella occidentalis]|uniref:Adult-specific cuticular protein ACP-20-like n=1 Tax=Frankliniella occidentalis TaxID=133901 RepID=A0A6J1S225_FRAOC|nr:adult-specific cuticular protein ACP-20-like [Frankliniella occidentalis]KAE8741460.1 Cuticle Protein CPR RR-2 16 [Frankliniella occidentalis]
MWTSLSVLVLGLAASVAAGVASAVNKRSLEGAAHLGHHSLPLEGEHHEQHHEEHYEEPKPYKFGYGVKDPHQGLDFNQQEASDGHTVTGHYRVQLPDGRTQVVTYTADWKNGYNANVQYEGEASHPKVIAAPSVGHGWSGAELQSSGALSGSLGGGSSSSEYYSSGDHSSKWTPSSHP